MIVSGFNQKNVFFSFLFFVFCAFPLSGSFAQSSALKFHYIVTAPDPASHIFHVELSISGWNRDSLVLKMPRWTPGYYQIMPFAKGVQNFGVSSFEKQKVKIQQLNENTWLTTGVKNKKFFIGYDVKAERKFVATSYLDSAHAYLVLGGICVYPENEIHIPVTIQLRLNPSWKYATGLEPVKEKPGSFQASDFDILYDSPILAGELEELPSFEVGGKTHRFIGYQLGDFDRVGFMKNLQSVVKAASDIISDIPYKEYTFIAIGPGRGGIEHLNNTTVSFSGKGLETAEGMNRMMNFLAHEYFHHYNVKRIRPFELGPFDYDRGSRTNLLWVSEGISVYYEYLAVSRAGLISEEELFADFESNVNHIENNPGRNFQSLQQASYRTWSDGPMGDQGDKGKTISYYEKGPLVGLILDLAIRHATANKKSLDDVMRFLYWHYYKEKNRGFTDAEFEQACEEIAGVLLTDEFEYVYTTRDMDYNKYLMYAGLKMDETTDKDGKKQFKIVKLGDADSLQEKILKSWIKG